MPSGPGAAPGSVRLLPGEVVVLDTLDTDRQAIDVSALLTTHDTLGSLRESLQVQVLGDGSVQVDVGTGRLVVVQLVGTVATGDLVE